MRLIEVWIYRQCDDWLWGVTYPHNARVVVSLGPIEFVVPR